jgi:hypothetical protein
VATQLTKKSPLAFVQDHMPLFLSQRVMLGVFAFIVALGLFGLLAGLHNARRAEEAARVRFIDAQALASLPPTSTDSIEDDLVVVNNHLATAEAAATPASIDGSDATATLLVRGAQSAGLSVKALSGVAGGQMKNGEVLYDTEGVRMTVDGATGQITSFLAKLGQTQPSLIPSLTSMTINDSGVAHAEIVFSTFTKVILPTPVPIATPKGGKS